MATTTARITQQQQFGYVEHTSVSGDTWQMIKHGTATSNGAANGTTVIDTNADSGSADTYNGAYWVKCTSGTNKDQWKRVVDDDGAGTLTFEGNGFPNQVDSAVTYEIWKSPEPIVAVTTGTDADTLADTARTEADDYWIGYYLAPISGSLRGEAPSLITDFTNATGTFELGTAFSGTPSTGDVFVIRKYVEIGSPSDGLARNYEPRLQTRVNFSVGDGTVTNRGGTFGFQTDVVASGTLAASGSNTNPSKLTGLIKACGLEETVPTTSTIGAGVSNTTAILVATGSWENHPIGSAVMYNGDVRFVASHTDGAAGEDTVTVTPPLPAAPTASTTLYGLRTYTKSTDGDYYGVCLEYEVDGVRHTMTGCKGNVALTDAVKPLFQFDFMVDHWTREIEAAPYNAIDTYTTTGPALSTDRQAWLDTTATDIGGFTCSANAEHAARPVQGSCGINGQSGYHLTNYNAGATFRELLATGTDEMAADERFGARTSFGLMVVYGGHATAFACRIPAARIIEDPKPADQDGMVATPSVVAAHDAGTQADGGGTSQKVPDFAIFLA